MNLYRTAWMASAFRRVCGGAHVVTAWPDAPASGLTNAAPMAGRAATAASVTGAMKARSHVCI